MPFRRISELINHQGPASRPLQLEALIHGERQVRVRQRDLAAIHSAPSPVTVISEHRPQRGANLKRSAAPPMAQCSVAVLLLLPVRMTQAEACHGIHYDRHSLQPFHTNS
jgi:hypothetical protein